jgi:hypothetical protein
MFSRVLALVVSSVCLIACSGEDPESTQTTASSSSASSSSSGGGGSGAGGGEGGAPQARPCVDSGDCNGRNGVPLCNVDVCVSGFCQVIFDAFGVLCGVPDKSEICDGKGQCGAWLPPNASTCYAPSLLTPSCPLCDDGDPATGDGCEHPDSGAPFCSNTLAPDGTVCGPAYVMSMGKCCPVSLVGG